MGRLGPVLTQSVPLSLKRDFQRSLGLIIVDPETHEVICYAQETREALPPDKVEQEINAAPARLFAKYPTKKPKADKNQKK